MPKYATTGVPASLGDLAIFLRIWSLNTLKAGEKRRVQMTGPGMKDGTV
ncbi:MAG: hypothetical protein J7J17_00480 [Hadesarchaea archaeon]|nr:hypothetical protein [Hadesarchaea archaeon]